MSPKEPVRRLPPGALLAATVAGGALACRPPAAPCSRRPAPRRHDRDARPGLKSTPGHDRTRPQPGRVAPPAIAV